MDKYIIQSGQVSLPGKDNKPFPLTQIQAYGQAADVVVLNPYGMHSNPPADSYAITFAINGQNENRAALCYKPDIRQKDLKPGETVFGNDVTGSRVFFDEDGNIIVNCENDENVTIKGACNITVDGDVTIVAPLVKVDGNFEVTGDTALGAVVTSSGTNISNDHKHSGVTTGAGITGDPV